MMIKIIHQDLYMSIQQFISFFFETFKVVDVEFAEIAIFHQLFDEDKRCIDLFHVNEYTGNILVHALNIADLGIMENQHFKNNFKHLYLVLFLGICQIKGYFCFGKAFIIERSSCILIDLIRIFFGGL